MTTDPATPSAPGAPATGVRGVTMIARQTVRRFVDDQMIDRAAALTYYAMMSLFPALFVVVALLGLLGNEELVNELVTYAADRGADETLVAALGDALTGLVSRAGREVGAALFVAVAIALYGASGAFGAAGRALNAALHIAPTDRFLVHKAKNLFWTLVIVLLVLITLVAVFLGGDLARDLLSAIGLGEAVGAVWHWVRWGVVLICVLAVYAIVFSFGPDGPPRPLRPITAGAVLGITAWIGATVGFSVYVRNFATYGATYGAFSAAVILLLWLWITNLCLLAGAELNAVLDDRHPRSAPDTD